MSQKRRARRHSLPVLRTRRHPPPPRRSRDPDLTLTFTEDAEAAYDYWRAAVDDPSFIYYIQGSDGGPVKIGRATNPYQRLGEIQVGNPDVLVVRQLLLGWAEGERSRQNEWSRALVRGEWYGRGLENVILAVAAAASRMQIEAHHDGLIDTYRIATSLPSVVYEEAREAA